MVVDETADIDKAARDIVFGASFDNNIICADEKECLVVASVADKLIKAMTYNGAYLITKKEQLAAVEKVVFKTKRTGRDRKPSRLIDRLIGKNASVILQKKLVFAVMTACASAFAKWTMIIPCSGRSR